MSFRYEAYNREGKRIRGLLEADSEEAAERHLWDSDLTIVDLKKVGKPFSLHAQLPSLFGVRDKDVIDFANQLAFLIEAGINIYTSLQMIRDQTTKPAFRAVLSSVVDDIVRGSTLSDACDRHPEGFPILFVRLIKVGEETGRLDAMLRKAAGYMERRRVAMAKAKSSLAYPAFVMVMAGVAMYILMAVALPSLMGLFREFRANPPLTTRILIGTVGFTSTWGLPILLGIVVVVVGVVLYRRTVKGKRNLDYLLIRAPVFGTLTIKLNLARLADTMGSLISGGVPLMETLELLVQTTQNAAVREPLLEIRDDILSGFSLTQAMSRHAIFPPMMLNLLRVGEESGTLEATLSTLGRLYNEEADRSIARLIGMMEPALTVGIGLVIGFIALAIISTIYAVMPQIH